jgi:hypothetical protein
MYVANSEPTIRLWGGGQAGVAERDLISGEPTHGEVGRDMGRPCALPREAFLCWYRWLPKVFIKPNRRGEPEAGQGTEGGRFTGILMSQGR